MTEIPIGNRCGETVAHTTYSEPRPGLYLHDECKPRYEPEADGDEMPQTRHGKLCPACTRPVYHHDPSEAFECGMHWQWRVDEPQIKRLTAERDALLACVRHYADDANWDGLHAAANEYLPDCTGSMRAWMTLRELGYGG